MDDRMAMDLAAKQHSLITHEQAREEGLSADQIQRRLNDGILVPAHVGVYRYASAPDTRAQRHLAACLAVGSVSAVSHRAAAAVHGMWLIPAEFVEISVSRSRSPELAQVKVHRLADLSSRWITSVDAVPVTTPARTLVDLGAVLPLGSVSRRRSTARDRASAREPGGDPSRHGRGGTPGSHRSRRDPSPARRTRRRPGSASVLEARMSTLLRLHGVPLPVPEHTVLDAHGQFVGRVDFAYPELRYAIEVDGYESHAGLRAFRHDRVRQNDLMDRGWSLHRFTWDRGRPALPRGRRPDPSASPPPSRHAGPRQERLSVPRTGGGPRTGWGGVARGRGRGPRRSLRRGSAGRSRSRGRRPSRRSRRCSRSRSCSAG